jgi:hypothetical protein
MKANSITKTFPLQYRYRFGDNLYTFTCDRKVFCLQSFLKNHYSLSGIIAWNITWEQGDTWIKINYWWDCPEGKPAKSSSSWTFYNLPPSIKIVPYES